MIYRYQDKIYLNVSDLDDAIAEEVGKNLNNQDPYESAEFTYAWEHEVDKLNENAWEVFAEWCKQEGFEVKNGQAVLRYYNEIKEGQNYE